MYAYMYMIVNTRIRTLFPLGVSHAVTSFVVLVALRMHLLHIMLARVVHTCACNILLRTY